MIGDPARWGIGGGGIAWDAFDGNRDGPGRGPISGREDSVSDGEGGIRIAGEGALASNGVGAREGTSS